MVSLAADSRPLPLRLYVPLLPESAPIKIPIVSTELVPPDCVKLPVPEKQPMRSSAAESRPLPLRLYVPLLPGLYPMYM